MITSMVFLVSALSLTVSPHQSTATSVQSNQQSSQSAETNHFGAPGCGPGDVDFAVKTDNGQHSIPSPDAGKAIIVFFQNDAMFGSWPRPTTRFGVDGTWAGATHANSFFYVSVVPGEHHLCASWQPQSIPVLPARPTAAAHFTAEAGQTYYFAARDFAPTNSNSVNSESELMLEPVDSDEAKILMNTFEFSSSHAKK